MVPLCLRELVRHDRADDHFSDILTQARMHDRGKKAVRHVGGRGRQHEIGGSLNSKFRHVEVLTDVSRGAVHTPSRRAPELRIDIAADGE